MIYEPKGKAREYSPLALNVYRNCDHQCEYCYVRNLQPGFSDDVKPVNLAGLDREAARADRQVLLCFTGDPYCRANDILDNTGKALKVLREYGCSVAILSKGGQRCLKDLDLFKSWPDGRVKIGATLTFVSSRDSQLAEPGAALPSDRVRTLEILHNQGVKTWVSIEPVIDPRQSLKLIELTIPFVDQFKVGKLNHKVNNTDWRAFAVSAIQLLRDAGKTFYVKFDLQAFLPKGYLTREESNPETVFLPDRPCVPSVDNQVMFPGF